MKKHLFALFISLFIFINPATAKVEEISVTKEIDMSVDMFGDGGKTLFMFLPHEYGLGEGYIEIANALAPKGMDFWAVDIHGSYMLSRGKKSLQFANLDHLMTVVNYSKNMGFEKLVLISSSRSSQLSLRIAKEWQINNPNSDYIKGHIFHSPHLIKDGYRLGDVVEYLDLAKASNLPVYAIYPEFDTKYQRTFEIAEALSVGGSSVFSHKLKEIRGGFHIREDSTIEEIDLKARSTLPWVYRNALNLLESIKVDKYKITNIDADAAKTGAVISDDENMVVKDRGPFQKYIGEQGLKIELSTYIDGNFDLAKESGSAILLNFWASWCGPCIREIPSLMRLKDILKNEKFKIITINVGESKEKIAKFKGYVDFDLPIAMDTDGVAIKEWKIYAYPSNFILDEDGKIILALKGAAEWDDKHIVKAIIDILKD
jgi:thiol-disulfide isomerase/thioredoxin